MMAPKIQEDENIINNNNNNKGDSPKFKLNIEDTAVHRGGNTNSNSTNNRWVTVPKKVTCNFCKWVCVTSYFLCAVNFQACPMKKVMNVMEKQTWRRRHPPITCSQSMCTTYYSLTLCLVLVVKFIQVYNYICSGLI